MLFPNRLEITNRGHLPESLTLESLRRSRALVPYNPPLCRTSAARTGAPLSRRVCHDDLAQAGGKRFRG
jgi:hypothetical protein